MSDQRRSSLRRVSVARTAILVVLVLLAMASFTPMLGPFRIFFRGVLMLGVVVLLGSYLWPWIRRFWPVIRRAWRAGRE